MTSFLRTQKSVVWRSRNAPIHKVESLSALLGYTHPPSPYIRISPQEEDLAQKTLPSSVPIVAFGLGANWTGKIWPVERFAELATHIASDQGISPKAHFLLLGSPAEKSLGTLFKNHLPSHFSPRIIDKIGDLSLLETSAFLRKSKVFIGNDSGLMHLAAASSTPTLGLFGPSNDIHYHPWGPHTHYVRTDVPYETLWPQRLHLKSNETLMESLSTQKVTKALETLLQKDSL